MGTEELFGFFFYAPHFHLMLHYLPGKEKIHLHLVYEELAFPLSLRDLVVHRLNSSFTHTA